PPKIRRQLFCYYKSDSPFTFLSPVGVEVHSIKPRILQFYDIVRNTTIHHILTRNAATLSRGRVLGSPEDRDVKSDVRTSQVTWLYDEATDEKVKYANLRIPAIIGDLTGLDARAGYTGVAAFQLRRNRGALPATFRHPFFKVTMGGGMAFPRVGVATPAVRRSAAFWYNLKKNGQPDPLSLHGGCPLVNGSNGVMGLVSGKGEDYYTSLVGLGQLAVHEQVILESVLDYKTALLKRLGLIERYLQEYESSLVSPQMEKNYPQLHKSIRKSRARHWDKKCVPTFQEHAELTDLQRYTVSNPIAAFRIIRRIGKQLVELLMDFETEIETDFVTLMDDMFDKIRIPNSEDVDGAVDGILRIQSTYGISIDQFVSGNFGVPGVGLTSAFDQHYVGVKASAMGFYAVGLQWLDTARKTLLQNYDPADETSLTLNMAEEVLLTTVRKVFQNILTPFLSLFSKPSPFAYLFEKYLFIQTS
ncbi:Prolyl 4-hydroxylase subunit alpha-3, partial [Folsomia candida]